MPVLWALLILAMFVFSFASCRPATTPTELPARLPADPACGATFVDRPIESLAQCSFDNGQRAGLFAILEIVGGGVTCCDYDRDGVTDLIIPRGGHIDSANHRVSGINSVLLRSDGAWNFGDRTASARLDTASVYTHGLAPADFDHDGFDDLLAYGYGGVVLLHNLGDGTFKQVAQFATPTWTTAAAWIDLDGDRTLDLYLGSYVAWDFDRHQTCARPDGAPDVCSPNAFEGTKSSVLLNNNDGSFTPNGDIVSAPELAKTLGAIAGEFTRGQGCGLYVANDLMVNYLFTRNGDKFREHALSSGVAVDDEGVVNGSMGIAMLDFNLDGQFDLFVTNFEHEKMALYVNQGQNSFHHVSRQIGLNRNDLRVVGFGTVAGDFDGDGDEDIIFTSGHVHYRPDTGPMEQLPAYLQNEAGRMLSKCTPKCNLFTRPAVGRGLAAADFDGDGDLDIIATHLFGPPAMIENVSSSHANWLSIALVGTESSRTPVGAIGELRTSNRAFVRQLFSGGSYLSQSESKLHFSWPESGDDAEPVSLTIHWPDGAGEESFAVVPNQSLTIIQGRGVR